MSGQWEVVGKKKSRDNKLLNKKNIVDSKKNSTPGPKIEEVFNPLQVKNLYTSNKSSKENVKAPEKPKQEIKKAPIKKQEKTQETTTKPKPKSMENALNSIDSNELKNLYENNKNLFPDSPIVWLKEISQFLNKKIHVDIQDHVFSSKPDNYPLSVVPVGIKTVMDKAVKEAGKSFSQTFYSISLTSMAVDMGKGMPVVGHKLFLQYLAFYDPNFTTASLSKHKELINSYQNQPAIGLSILWALGQCGNKDFESGIKIFQEIMLAMIEMKNYSRYITKFLIDLINKHETANMSKEQYLLVLDIIYANFKNFPTDLRPKLDKLVPTARKMLFNESKYENFSNLIEPMLKKILSNRSNLYKKEVCWNLVFCFIKHPKLLSNWNKLYSKNVQSSVYLLKYIDENWKKISTSLNVENFSELLDSFAKFNEDLKSSKKKVEGVEESISAIKNLRNKMVSKKNSKSSYGFKSFLLILAIGGIVAYDAKLNGCWYKTSTYNGLKNVGAVNVFNNIIEKGQLGLIWAQERFEEQFPGSSAVIAKEAELYYVLFRDLGLIFRNAMINIKDAINDEVPHVVNTFESYAPGFLDKSQKTVQHAWSTSVVYFNKSMNYLQQEVFVGNLAPENVQKVVIEALNVTQRKAAEYYYWVYEKVQSNIK